jgi:hypothetical protein
MGDAAPQGIESDGWQQCAGRGCVGSLIHLPAIDVRRSIHEAASINPADLDAALERDKNK